MLGNEDFFADIFSNGGADAVIDIATPPISPLYPAGMSPLSPHCCQHRAVGTDCGSIECVDEYVHVLVVLWLNCPNKKSEGRGHYGKADYLCSGSEPISQFCAGVGVGVGPLRAHGAELAAGVCVFIHASID